MTYQTEVTIMKNNIEKMRKTVKESMNEFDAAAEFGIDSESYKSIFLREKNIFSFSSLGKKRQTALDLPIHFWE